VRYGFSIRTKNILAKHPLSDIILITQWLIQKSSK
jgi:hypothetical protein